ncbi:hypothetical protein H8S95_17820 [Pontibacter sp. KCTC 32443]|uniref:hypothetical protein n=1 Tax=Pontibacter TaxID=323449 RepID=UPI00164E5848|nr:MULTISPECIES: hypothetical protein [Pontibacter]MBC5775938.1 hypothetical protein [Pontibacter sp. KCTC 32443]
MFPVKAYLRKALLFIALLCVQQVYAKDIDYIKAYHPVIHEAELLLLNKDYSSALDKYKDAFKAVPEPFARDYYNAAVCAMLSENYEQTFDYLEELVLKGVELPFIRKQEVFKPLHETKEWDKFLDSYPKRRKKYKRHAELDIRADLDDLYARDKYYRLAKGGVRIYADTLRKIENDNVDILLRTIQKHGYPGEKLIGVGDTIEQLPRFSIVIERQTKAKKGFDFTDILKEAVQQGKLSPQAAAYLMETQQGVRKYKTRALVWVSCSNPKDCAGDKKLKALNKYLVEDLNDKEEQKVNAFRAELGLEPLADYRKKVLYNLNDTRFMLSNKWSVGSYVVPSKEAAKALTQGLVIAKKTTTPE